MVRDARRCRSPHHEGLGISSRLKRPVMAGQKCEARLRTRCPGHPRLPLFKRIKDVDARHKAGHDDFDWKAPILVLILRRRVSAVSKDESHVARGTYPPLPPITARTVSSGPKSSAPST